jgi:hypothetical protein
MSDPICPRCKQPFAPLTPHDRQQLALANNFPWVCPRCFAVSDGQSLLPIESVKAQERAHFLAIIQSLQTVTTPMTLLDICEGLRAGLAATSPTRHAWAEVAPELLRALWETMERIGGVTPSAPAVVTTQLGIARAGDDEAYIRKVADAINDVVVRWCEAKQAAAAKTEAPAAEATQEARAQAAAQPTPATGPRVVRRSAGINARMLEEIQANPDAMGWSCKQWAQHLKCAKSSVVETQTWKDLAMRREREKAERAQDRRRRPKASYRRPD